MDAFKVIAYLPEGKLQGKIVIHRSDIDQVEKILAQHIARLQASLQHA